MENASNSTDELANSVNDVDNSPIDEVSDSANDADESLGGASESAENLSVSITNIDPSVLEQLGIAANEAGDGMDGASDNATSMFDAMASATIGAGMTAGLVSASQAAGNYQDTMVRLGYAMSGTSMSAEQAEKTYGSLISSMASETGRGAGAVRAHLLNMGNAGITNEKVLSDSFSGISKASFQMGESMDSMDAKFQTMTLTGMASSRMLKSFGLTTDDLAKAMGVSADEVKDKFKDMDANTRASVLSTALNMKYGADVTENYKNSYQHLTEELDRAKEYLIRVVGEALLPTVIPAMQKAGDIINGLAGAFKGLPAPIRDTIGGFGGLVLGASAVGLALNGVFKVVGAVISPFRQLYDYFRVIPDGENLTKFQQHLTTLKDTAGAVKDKFSGLKESIGNIGSSIASSFSGALSSLKTNLSTIGSSISTSFSGALSSLKQNAISAGSTIRSSLGGALTSLKTTMQTSVIPALQTGATKFLELGRNALTAGANALTSAGGWIAQKLALVGATIASYAQAVATQAVAVAQALLNIVMAMNPIMLVVIAIIALVAILIYLYYNVDSVRQAIDQLWQAAVQAWNGIVSAFMGIWNSIKQALTNAWNKVTSFASNLISGLVNGARQAVSGFTSFISSLPGKLSQELQNMLSTVSQWASTLPQKFWEAGVNAVKNFLNALGIHSPGFMQIKLLKEMEDTGDRIPTASQNIIRNLENVGENAVKSFGNPKFDVGFDTDSLNDIKSPKIDFSNGNLLRLLTATDENKSGNVLNLTLNVGTVDKRERIEEIIEVIRNEIFWDNKTAGRTI